MSGLTRLGEEIARELDALREAAPPALHVREHLAHLQQDVARPRARPLWAGALALATLGAAAAAWLLWLRPAAAPAPLTLAVGALLQPAAAGAWVEADQTRSLPMRFSDGTRIEIAPRSRARVVELNARGAHLLLESGLASVKVTRRPHAAWQLSAGPFAVKVTGTRFEVRWNPEQDDFALTLTEGHVEVSGCAFGQGYRMSAGQTVRASCSQGRFDVTAATSLSASPSALGSKEVPPPSAATQAAQEPQDQDLPVDVTSNAGARTRSAAPRALAATGGEHGASWRVLAEQGNYTEALAAANAIGFQALCAQAGAAELNALADTARYAGDTQEEAQALLLLRRRFAHSERSALAAFALGRLEFDGHGSYRKAAGWFRTYLKEQPRGPLMREARGRLMEATSRAGDSQGASELAARYLHDYPTGPHAKLARSIVAAAAL